MPSWIRDRSEDMLRRGTADIAVGTDEVRMNLIAASLKQSSQVEYVRVELIDAGYDIKYSNVSSGTGAGITVHVDISDDVAAGWSPILVAHTHTRLDGGRLDYMSVGDRQLATDWGVPVVAWSPNRSAYTAYVPDGVGVSTGMCYGPGCVGSR